MRIAIYEDPRDWREPPAFAHDLSLNVTRHKGEYLFELLDDDNELVADGVTGNAERIDTIVDPLCRALSRAAATAADVAADDPHVHQVTGAARDLYARLIPEPIKDALSAREGGRLAIGSNTEDVPWEALHDGDAFWADRHFVYRIPRVVRSGSPMPPRNEPHASQPGLAIAGGGLTDELVAVARKLSTCLGTRFLQRPKYAEFVQACRCTRFLLLVCHGLSEPQRLLVGGSDLEEECLHIHGVQTLGYDRGAVVLLNACCSSGSAAFLDIRRSFGWEFYASGAAAVIGTNAEVSEADATAFAQRFADALPSSDVVTAFEQATRSSWLRRILYAYYGNARHRLELRDVIPGKEA